MAENAPVVGTIKTPNNGLTVQRAGQTLTLNQGDALQWGDVVANTSPTPAEIMIPAQYQGQGATLLKLQPNAQAEIRQIASPLPDGSPRTEVLAMTEGVELYDIDNDVSSAVVTPYDGEFSGLIGAGLAGSGAAAALGGAGLIAAALAFRDDGNDETPTEPPPPTNTMAPTPTGTPLPTLPVDPTPAPSGNPTPAPSGNPTPAPSGNPTPAPSDAPTSAPTPAPADPAGVVGGVDSLNAFLQTTPLEPLTAVTGAVADGLETVGTQVVGFGEQDPSGLANLLGNTVGAPIPGYDNTAIGVGGVVTNVATGLQEGGSSSQLAALTDPLSGALGTVGGQIAANDPTSGTGTAGPSPAPAPGLDALTTAITPEAFAPLVQNDPTGLAGTLVDTLFSSPLSATSTQSEGTPDVLGAVTTAISTVAAADPTGTVSTVVNGVTSLLTDPRNALGG